MASRAGSGGGFTLIEVLTAMVLMGLVVAFAIPKLDLAAYRVSGGVRSVAALLQRAQRLAVTNQSNVNVLLDVAHNAIEIHEDVNNDNVIQPTERVRSHPLEEGVVFGLGGAPLRLYAPPVSFTRTLDGAPEIVFRRDGSASENGGLYVTTTAALRSSRPRDARSIEVTRATGRVSWYQYTGSAWVRKF